MRLKFDDQNEVTLVRAFLAYTFCFADPSLLLCADVYHHNQGVDSFSERESGLMSLQVSS